MRPLTLSTATTFRCRISVSYSIGAAWEALAAKLNGGRNCVFGVAPHVRFKGKIGEQATMFFRDPSGNALEFKAFRDPGQIFAR